MTRVDWAEVRRRVDAVGRALAGDGDDLPERAREVLEARARALAVRPPEPPRGGEAHLVEFSLAGETYAVDPRHVVEAARAGRATPLPGARPPLVAVTAWRGELLPVIDLRAALGLSPAPGEREWMLVLGTGRAALAVPVDDPGEFRVVPAASLLPPPEGEARRHVRALTPDAVAVLDAAALLAEYG